VSKTIYLEARDLAERWGVSERSIWRWVKSGIPNTAEPFPFCQVGRKTRWTEDQVRDIEAAMTRVGYTPGRRGKRRKVTAA
jgi:predicted DNA-binding transcriptional regulator AlpA